MDDVITEGASLRRATLALGPLLALTVLTACGGDGDPTASASPSTTAPTTAAPTTAAPTSESPSGGPGCPSRTAPASGTVVATATVTGKKVDAPSRTVTVKVGTRVRVAITSDVADEVHVHTYDVREDVTPGCPSALEFVANIPGTVEVELEEQKVHVLEIKATQ